MTVAMTSDGARATALWEQALAFGDGGRPAAAVRVCERALRRGLERSPGIHAQMLITLACFKSELGDVSAALGHLDRAMVVDSDCRAAALAARGFVLLRGANPDALSALDEAIAALVIAAPKGQQRGAGPSDLAAALLNRGLIHMSLGRLVDARTDTQAAEAAAVAAGRPGVVLMARHNLGYIRFLSGDLPGALHHMAEASTVLPGADLGVQALDRARVLLATGLATEAGEFTDQAVAAFTANRAMPDLADALQVRAEIDLAMGDAVGARRSARRAARIAARRGNDRAATVGEVIELRADALSRRASAGSRTALRRRAIGDAHRATDLANRLSAMGLTEDALAARLLQVEAQLDAGSGVRLSAGSAAARGERSANLAIRLHARVISARLELAAGQPGAGLTHVRRGLDDLARFQAKFGSQDLQSGAAVHGRELAALGLRTAVGTGSPAAILQWLERSRAVSTRLPAVRPPADSALAEDLGSLRVAFDRARQAALAGRRDAGAQRRVAELRRSIRSRSWTAGGTGAVDRPPTMAAVQRALAARAGTSVLAFFHGFGRDHLLVITKRSARYLRLGVVADTRSRARRASSDLDALADIRLPQPLQKVAIQSLSATLEHLSCALVEPALPLLDDGPLLIVDAGPTAALPWAQLPAFRGRTMSVTSSVTRAVAGLTAPDEPAHRHGVLAVAGPEVGNGEKEARAVAALHPAADLLTGDEATGRGVLDAMPADGLVHIAAHGHHEPDNPLFSGLLLADGLLFGYDVAPNLALPRQIVLSSCDVGQTDDRPGGEPLGLVAALVRSGVSTVITGTSRIADTVAEAAMLVYHQGLLAGASPAQSLVHAIEVASNDTGLPAPLTCFGAGL